MKKSSKILKMGTVFLLLSMGVYFYAYVGSKEAAPTESLWSSVEAIRQQLQKRKIEILEGSERSWKFNAFSVNVSRLSNVEFRQKIARYIVSVRPTGVIPVKYTWLKKGVDIGFIDLHPLEKEGNLRLASFRRVDDMKI